MKDTTKGKVIISNDAMQSILDERLTHLASQGTWYFHKSTVTRYLVKLYYQYRFEMITKKYTFLLNARKYF